MAKKKEYDRIDEYINAMREPTDGCLTGKEQVKYNILSNREWKDITSTIISTIERMLAYERFLIQECRWRYPNKKSRILNKKESDKEWKEFCKPRKGE